MLFSRVKSILLSVGGKKTNSDKNLRRQEVSMLLSLLQFWTLPPKQKSHSLQIR